MENLLICPFKTLINIENKGLIYINKVIHITLITCNVDYFWFLSLLWITSLVKSFMRSYLMGVYKWQILNWSGTVFSEK